MSEPQPKPILEAALNAMNDRLTGENFDLVMENQRLQARHAALVAAMEALVEVMKSDEHFTDPAGVYANRLAALLEPPR